MSRTLIYCVPLLLLATAVAADDSVEGVTAPQRAAVSNDQSKGDGSANDAGAKAQGDVKMSGMSILGNDEAPKSLVIVPWKGSQLGDMPGLSRLLDDSTQPVDKDVFIRELAYYRIRSNSK